MDIRGVAANSERDLLGLSNFEQTTDTATDTTIYGFRKYIGLILNCNPNTIEMLGCRPDSYALVSPSGQMLLANKELFLSRKAIYSFGGYANSQLRRLQNGLSKDVSDVQKAEYTLSSCKHAIVALADRYGLPHDYVDVALDGTTICVTPKQVVQAPLNAVKAFYAELSSIIESYESFGRRNQRAKDKSPKQLNKHAMHLVRLYLMVFDILEKGEINTYREKDHNFLMSIRNGDFMKEDGTFMSEFFELVNEYEERLAYAGKNTSLPDRPNMAKVEELVVEINRKNLANR